MGRGGAIAALLVLVRPEQPPQIAAGSWRAASAAHGTRRTRALPVCLQAALALPVWTFVEPSGAGMARRRRVWGSPVLEAGPHRFLQLAGGRSSAFGVPMQS